MKKIIIITIIVFTGCGQQPEMAKPGIYGDLWPGVQEKDLRKQFQEVKSCMVANFGSFDNLAIVIETETFRCGSLGDAYYGCFLPPNIIRIVSPVIWRHEVIHYLHYENFGGLDAFHRSDYFRKCT